MNCVFREDGLLTGLANVALVVRDCDEAIGWSTEVVGLELRMDGSMGDGSRFATVSVRGQGDLSTVLHKFPAHQRRG